MNKNTPFQGAYSRRFSNATFASSGQGAETLSDGNTHVSKTVRVITTANDRSMGDVKITTIGVLQEVKPDKDYVTNAGTTYSRYTPTTGSSYARGTRIVVEANPYTGFKFVRWGDGETARRRVITLDRNLTLVANFAPINSGNGGNGGNGGSGTTSDRTAKVVWDGRMGSVSGNGLVLGSETPASSGTITTGQGSTVKLTATPKDGFHFVKWVGGPSNGTQNTPAYTFQMNNNYNITAVFEGDKITPSVDNEDPVGEEPAGGDIPHVIGGGGGGEIVPETPTQTTASASKKETGLKAFVKKWWWAILIVAYIVYKEGKGGSK